MSEDATLSPKVRQWCCSEGGATRSLSGFHTGCERCKLPLKNKTQGNKWAFLQGSQGTHTKANPWESTPFRVEYVCIILACSFVSLSTSVNATCGSQLRRLPNYSEKCKILYIVSAYLIIEISQARILDFRYDLLDY